MFRRNREGAGLPLPEGGFRRYTAVLGTNLWKLIELNLLFLLFCLPVVTIPAALCGMNRVCMLLIRNGYCFLWDDFWQEFRRSFKRTLLPGLLFGLLTAAGYYCMSLGLSNSGLALWSTLFWALGMVCTAAGLCWGSYFFALTSLLEQDVPVLMTNFPTILNRMTGLFGSDRADFLANLNAYDLLILDDLGAERGTEYALEQVFAVIDARYRSRKPLIVTTNLTLDALKNPDDLAHARIYDRILEICAPILFSGENLRVEKANETKTAARSLLLPGNAA